MKQLDSKDSCHHEGDLAGSAKLSLLVHFLKILKVSVSCTFLVLQYFLANGYEVAENLIVAIDGAPGRKMIV